MKAITKRVLSVVAVFSFFSLISIFWCRPVLSDFSRLLVGLGGDRYIFIWNFWWFSEVIKHPELSLYFTSSLFYPFGTHLIYHSFSLVNCILAFLVSPVFSLTEQMNLLFFLSFPFAGITMYLLARHNGCSRISALVSGLIFTFWTGHWAHGEHLNLVSIQWIPLFILSFTHILFPDQGPYQGKVTGNLLLCSVFSAFMWLLNAFTCWYYGVYLFLFVLVAGIIRSLQLIGSRQFTRYFPSFIFSGFVMFLIVSSILFLLYGNLFPILAEKASTDETLLLPEGNLSLEQLVLPSIQHPFWGKAMEKLTFFLSLEPQYGFDGNVFPGYLAFLLAITGFLRISRTKKIFWFFVLFFFLLLSSGEKVTLLGSHIPMLTPYNLFEVLPFFQLIRVPNRAMVMVMVIISLLAGTGFQYIIENKSNRVKGLFVFLIVILVLLEYHHIPTPMKPTDRIPETFKTLRNSVDKNAILTLSDRAHEARQAMFFQTVHQKPISHGFVSHMGTSSYEIYSLYSLIESYLYEREKQPLRIQQLQKASGEQEYITENSSYLAEILSYFSIKWVTLYPNFWVQNLPRNIRILERELGPVLEYSEPHHLRIFAVPEVNREHSFVFLGKGFQLANTGYLRLEHNSSIVFLNRLDAVPLVISFELLNNRKIKKVVFRDGLRKQVFSTENSKMESSVTPSFSLTSRKGLQLVALDYEHEYDMERKENFDNKSFRKMIINNLTISSHREK